MNVLILGPEKRNRNIIEFLKARGHEIARTEDPITLECLREKRIDFLISFGYAPVLKPPVTTEYRKRIINVHPAYLPQGRGIYTNFWSCFEGRPQGVSIHFIDEGIDTGDVIARRRASVAPNATLRTSHAVLDREVEKLFFEAWHDIETGALTAIDQRELGGGGRYRNRVDSERVLDLFPRRWDTPVTEVEQTGAECFLSAEFWRGYEADVRSLL